IIALLKPHYESEKGELIKGVVPLEKVENIKDRIVGRIQSLGRSDSDESSDSKRYKVEQVMESPVLGGSGNKEFLLKIR
ncbi:MAG: hypothetical protein Q7S44_01980, partial [bacterium]|nr:hypothetical protein [bacterium]